MAGAADDVKSLQVFSQVKTVNMGGLLTVEKKSAMAKVRHRTTNAIIIYWTNAVWSWKDRRRRRKVKFREQIRAAESVHTNDLFIHYGRRSER